MAIQTSSLTTAIRNAQAILVAEMMYAAEFETPCQHLVTRFTLDKGSGQLNVPQFGQMTAQDLTEGVDMVNDEETITNYIPMTTDEIGLKVILTDKFVRQATPDMFRACGKAMGEAVARKIDEDLIALFAGLNSGVTLGVANCDFSLDMAMNVIAWAKSKPCPPPVYLVHHPNTLAVLNKSAAAVGSMAHDGHFVGLNETTKQIVEKWHELTLGGVALFSDGNIPKTAGDDAVGAIFSKSALYLITSLLPTSEVERDASLRASEIVLVTDTGCGELYDDRGAPLTYKADALATTST